MQDDLPERQAGPGLLWRRLSRLELLKGASTIALAAPLLSSPGLVQKVGRLDPDGEPNLRPEARLPLNEFFAHYEPSLRGRRIRIGCSFAPEYFGARAEGGQPGADETALRALRAAVEDLGMADIRLGLRWDNFAPDGFNISSFYRPYLDYCFGHPAVRTVALDLGPIKTFRWPEIHVPRPVLDSLRDVPAHTATIEPESELARVSFEHMQRAVDHLGREYDGAKRVSISFNEPFHPFGRYRWGMSEGYLERLVDIVLGSGYFEGAGFLVNSAQALDLKRIAGFFKRLVRTRPELRGRLVSGFDIYPFLPPVIDVPVLRQIAANIRLVRRDWGDAEVGWNLRHAHDPDYGYRIEVTEAQAEPFGAEKVAGNSLPHYQHVLAQCLDRILDPAQDESVIRIFGVEYQLQTVFSGAATAANRQILDLTRRINDLAARP